MRRGYRRPPFLTIGVWCVWLHSANCSLSIRVLVSAFVVSVSRSHIYADICIFLMFAVNSLRVRRYWQSANLLANMCILDIENYVQTHQNSYKKHPKSSKMVPMNAPKTTLGANWFEDPQKVFQADTFFADFWRHWANSESVLMRLWSCTVNSSSQWQSRG